MVYVANTRLFLRAMSELEARAIPGTEVSAGSAVTSPVFSPDGQSLVFWSGVTAGEGTLKRIAVTGGAAVTICQATNPAGVSWSGDQIVFGQGRNGIMRVPASALLRPRPEPVRRRITTQPSFTFGNPVRIPLGPIVLANTLSPRTFDITRDGRIVGIIAATSSDQTQAGTPAAPQIHVVLNWFEELKRLVATR